MPPPGVRESALDVFPDIVGCSGLEGGDRDMAVFRPCHVDDGSGCSKLRICCRIWIPVSPGIW